MPQWVFFALVLIAVAIAAMGVVLSLRLWKRYNWDAIKTEASEERGRVSRSSSE